MAKQTKELLTFEIGITKHVSATWPDMDFRAVCHLDQHDTAPGVTLAVRATTEKQAGELCGEMGAPNWPASRGKAHFPTFFGQL